MGARELGHDKAADRHYDIISAFIKSMRGSDVDAALYWLHTMLAAGEDPKFIARRMIILASEDIGLADNRALAVAVDAFRALEVIGLPEATYALTHAVIYLTTAPKSNTVGDAIGRSRRLVDESPAARVPAHLREVEAGSPEVDEALVVEKHDGLELDQIAEQVAVHVQRHGQPPAQEPPR